jgi:hypothetical protein
LAVSALLLLIPAGKGGSLRWLATADGLTEFAAILLVAVLPASLPMTFVGAWGAARIAARQRYRRPLSYWLLGASTVGSVLGAIGAALWFGAINATYFWDLTWSGPPPGMIGANRWEMLAFLSFMALVGGAAGAFVGAMVGLFCWRSTATLPNDALQLTSGAAGMNVARS